MKNNKDKFLNYSKSLEQLLITLASRKILRKFNFIDSNHNLKDKARLLSKLNGYEQIPIIESILIKTIWIKIKLSCYIQFIISSI